MVVSVIPDAHIDKVLDYSIPEELKNKIHPGMRVKISIRGKPQKGTVYEIKEKTNISSIYPLLGICKEIFSADLLQLAKWISLYYATPLSKVIRTMIPSSLRKEQEIKTHIFLTTTKSKKQLITLISSLRSSFPMQAKVLEIILKTKRGIFLKELVEQAKISPSPITTLIKKKILSAKKILPADAFFLFEKDYFSTKSKMLNPQQKECLDSIAKSLHQNVFSPHLIFGVTGSGKTEIYLQAMQYALERKKGIILLVPEIALTSQTIERIYSRFQQKIAILHHRRSHSERLDAWDSLLRGKTKIAIGARSAIFSPVQNLGLIIMDEEHDSSYKQTEEIPTYHARHIALMRAKQQNCTILLGSATPSLESFFHAQNNLYHLHTLSQRATDAPLPSIRIVDMKEEYERTRSFLFSTPLLDAIEKRFQRGEQSLLFLNRRGYHTLLFCKQCNHVFECNHCSVSLTFHRKENLLFCHSCGYKIKPPNRCPKCLKNEHLQYRGYGTEQVEMTLKAIFPHMRTLRLDRDTTQRKNSHEQVLKEFRSGKADILIGTQMIVKGLHFPCVTLVGVLNCDSGLHFPEYRASEEVFQMLTQVAGRSGRCELPGEVIIQTFFPHHPTILLAAKQDYVAFYNQEIENRKIFCYPPFSHIIKIVFSGTEEKKTLLYAQQFRKNLIDSLSHKHKIHPVIPAAKPKIEDRFRFLFLVRTNTVQETNKKISQLLQKTPYPSSIRSFIDVDPILTSL